MSAAWEQAGLRFEEVGVVGILTIDRQERLNAIDPGISLAIREAAQHIEASERLRVGVFTGAGERAFCVGADLKAGGSQVDEIGGWGGFVRFERKKPFIAAVNGMAVGGGLEIALACDFIYAADHARFGFPEVAIGVAAGAGGMIRFPRIVGLSRAKEHLLTGQLFDAATASEMGLINKVVPADRLRESVLSVAEKIGANAPLSVELSRWVADTSWGKDDAQSWEISDRASDILLTSADADEGRAAFLEKRPPRWMGR
ncbi:enoyl-CoA hydratase/isomerase family protein [Microbacterium sp.]|uniref:enoyl-CoA hydratase/isomerase family protein n=1 Tax=Microbacterium sp. TaxID=51671 RepID=UPI003A86F6F5